MPKVGGKQGNKEEKKKRQIKVYAADMTIKQGGFENSLLAFLRARILFLQSVTAMAAPPPHRLLGEDILALLTKRNPDPEPTHQLQEDEGEEDAVLETVAAPRRGLVAVVVPVRRRVAEDAARACVGVYRRRGRECKSVKYEEEEDGHSERGWFFLLL